ncbi:MAG: enoyl-CoA hydratase/isomerase family protein [Actinomycetota bacterium]
MQFDTVLYEVDAGVAVITLNRPEAMNSWTPQLSDELMLACGAADADDEVRVLVITANGRAFCAGADLSGGESGFVGGGPTARKGPRLWPHQVRKPVIAAINGHAVGVGITYPMLCDIRIVSETAKIQYAMVRRGVIPELGSHALLPRVIGFAKAAELMLTGRQFLGAEAVELGLASRAVPAEQVLAVAMEMARDIAVNVAPVSAALAKKLMWEGLNTSVDTMLALESSLLPELAAMPDSGEGVRAFFEKREPQWQGRVSSDVPNVSL